jgi:uncharacterized coiled-coil protein SlyX
MPTGKQSSSRFPDWYWKVLSVLVIPLLGWGVKLEVNNAVQNDRIAVLQKTVEVEVGAHTARITALESTVQVQGERIATLKDDLKDAMSMRGAINANTLELAKLGVKIDAIIRNFKDVKTLLSSP